MHWGIKQFASWLIYPVKIVLPLICKRHPAKYCKRSLIRQEMKSCTTLEIEKTDGKEYKVRKLTKIKTKDTRNDKICSH